MRRFWNNCLRDNVFFWTFALAGLFLIIASFILPPMGVIDNSVLAAVGELDGVIALGAVIKAIDNGVDTTFSHNGTSVTVSHKDEDGEETMEEDE